MKLTIGRTLLANEVAWVARALVGRGPDAVASVKLTADADGLELVAHTYDDAHRARVPAQVLETGSLAVPGAAFNALLAQLRDPQVSLERERNYLALQCGRVRTLFPLALDPDPWKPAKPAGLVAVDGEELAAVCSRLGNLCGRQNDAVGDWWVEAYRLTREADSDELRVFAGTRYHVGRTMVPASGAELDVLAPAKVLQAALAGAGGPLELYTAGGTLYVADRSGRRAGVRLYDLAGEKTFPAGALQLFDAPPADSWTFSREQLLRALKLVATGSDRARLSFGPDSLTVDSHTPSKGEARAEVSDVLEAQGSGEAEYICALEFLVPHLNALAGDELTARSRTGGLKLALSISDQHTDTVLMTVNNPGRS